MTRLFRGFYSKNKVVYDYNQYYFLKVTGSLGVLIKAKEEGYIQKVKPFLEAISKSEVYISDKLIMKALEICAE